MTYLKFIIITLITFLSFGLSLQARSTNKLAKIISNQGNISITEANKSKNSGTNNSQFPQKVPYYRQEVLKVAFKSLQAKGIDSI